MVRVPSVLLFFATGFFLIAGAVFLAWIGAEALAGRNPFQFFADSGTYLRMYHNPSQYSDGELVGVSANFIGPMAVLSLVRGNIYLVMVVNAVIFLISLLWITKHLSLNPLKTGCVLGLSTLTLSSVLSVNKEIFTYPFIALALAAQARRSLVLAIAAFVVALFIRWQMALFWVVLVAVALLMPLIKRRTVAIGLLLAGTSVGYLALNRFLAPVIAAAEASIAEDWDQGSGLFALLLEYQNQGFYFLVFPVKALHLMFALGVRFDRLFAPTSIYNDVFIVLHCTAALVVWLLVIRAGRFRLRNDLVFASIVFLVVFCLSPIYAPRYLYPVFVAWVLVLLGGPERLPTRR